VDIDTVKSEIKTALNILWQEGNCTRTEAIAIVKEILDKNLLTDEISKVKVHSLGEENGFTVVIDEEGQDG
jgi:hypothetical protein